MRDGKAERQRDNSNLRTGSADSNEGLITVPPLVVEDYECSPRREWVRGRINSAGWWQDRSRRVNVAREWRLNDPRGQCGTGHDDRWKSFSQRHSSLCTGITNVCTQTCICDELSKSSEETRIRDTYAIIRKFPVVYDAREEQPDFAVFTSPCRTERSVSTRKTWLTAEIKAHESLRPLLHRYIIFYIWKVNRWKILGGSKSLLCLS